MDTGKLLNIIQDLQVDEQKHAIQSKLQNILNYLRENNTENVTTELASLESSLNEAIVNNFAKTDQRGLDELGVSGFFGPPVMQKTNAILRGRSDEVISAFEQYITDRQNVLNRLNSARSSLGELNLKARTLQDSQFELGFSFPKHYTNLGELSEALKDIKLFLENLAEAVGDKEPLEIVSVSNGTIEIFINAGMHLASHFDIIIQRILEIKGVIELCKDIKGYTQGFVPEARAQMEEANKKNAEVQIDSIVESLPVDVGISDPAKQSSIKKLFGLLVGHFEKGLEAELKTPSLAEPVDPGAEASSEDKQDYQNKIKTYSLKQKIDEKNKEFQLLQKNDFQEMKTQLLNSAKRINSKTKKKRPGKKG